MPASNPCVTPGQHWTPESGEDMEPDPIDPYALLAQTLAERRTLLRLCLYALDRARSAGVAERIEQGLASIGVLPIRPDGQPFDPTRHEAAGTVPTDDPRLEGLVAETEVPGYADNGRTLRVPVVTVYQVVR
jgi:molecular chaperone GrpE